MTKFEYALNKRVRALEDACLKKIRPTRSLRINLIYAYSGTGRKYVEYILRRTFADIYRSSNIHGTTPKNKTELKSKAARSKNYVKTTPEFVVIRKFERTKRCV